MADINKYFLIDSDFDIDLLNPKERGTQEYKLLKLGIENKIGFFKYPILGIEDLFLKACACPEKCSDISMFGAKQNRKTSLIHLMINNEAGEDIYFKILINFAYKKNLRIIKKLEKEFGYTFEKYRIFQEECESICQNGADCRETCDIHAL